MTPRELIEMLGRWDSDKQFEILLQNNPFGGTDKQVILVQGSNAINLMPGRPKETKVEVRELDEGTLFGWNDSVWEVSTRGLGWVDVRDVQFSTNQMFYATPKRDERSWHTLVSPMPKGCT
jgi:hypothetical protein